MKITYKKSQHSEVNKNGDEFHWYQSSTGAWVLDHVELGVALGMTKKAVNEFYKKLPESLQTTYLHSAGTELFLRLIKDVTEGRSRKVWNLVKGSFYMDEPSEKWDIPVLPYRKGAKQILAVDTAMLNQFKVYPAQGAVWSSDDCIEIEEGTFSFKAIPLAKLITLDAQYNEFAAKVLQLPPDAAYKDFKACVRQAAKMRQLAADLEPMDEKASAFKLRKDLNTTMIENEKLRNLLHKHGIDPAGRATDSSNVLIKTTDKANASLEKQKAIVQRSLQNYVAQMHGSLKAQACLLEAASHELHQKNTSWRHADFLKLFDNELAMSVLRAAQDDMKSKDEDGTDLLTLERFIENHMGYKNPLVRDLVANSRDMLNRRELDKRKQ